MRKLLVVLFLCSLVSGTAFAKEVIMKCPYLYYSTYKYVKKLIFRDRVYYSQNATWIEWCAGEYVAENYNAFCPDATDPEDPKWAHHKTRLDFSIYEYYDNVMQVNHFTCKPIK
tara:strand:+ start:623 stop:964 length:342 start_codon:yes stop_codon:yes gene_type:complete